MNKVFNRRTIAQAVVVVICALALKQYYSSASADQLRWILTPTTLLVELISGVQFEFESHAGYLSRERNFLIAPACAGVNFLITAFLMLSARQLLRAQAERLAWRAIPIAILIAYGVTIIANTFRISIAIEMLQQSTRVGNLNPEQLHRLEGIFVYFGFLLLLFVISEKIGMNRQENSYRQYLLPLVIYYFTTLAIPLANSGFKPGSGFCEHAIFVIVIPLVLILPLAAYNFYFPPDGSTTSTFTDGRQPSR